MNFIISQEASRDLDNIWAYTYQIGQHSKRIDISIYYSMR